ncbi:hypothetical protein GYMLUDRAFT_65544, partial [Collybiopsis luxurians FD-317 M1]
YQGKKALAAGYWGMKVAVECLLQSWADTDSQEYLNEIADNAVLDEGLQGRGAKVIVEEEEHQTSTYLAIIMYKDGKKDIIESLLQAAIHWGWKEIVKSHLQAIADWDREDIIASLLQVGAHVKAREMH